MPVILRNMDTLRGIKAAAMTILVAAFPVAALTLSGEPERQKELAAELPSAAGVIEAAKENSVVISLPDSGLPPAGGEVLSLELSPELQEFDRRNAEATFFRNTKNRSKAVDYFNFYASLYGSMELMIQTQATLNVLVTYNCNFKPYFQEYSPMYGGREFTEKIEKTLYLWPQNNCNFIDVKEAIEQAWMNAPRESEPRSELERRIKRLYRTRRERWQRLAGQLGIKMPVAFRAYRGIRSHTFSPDAEMEALAEILAAWEETGKETMQMPGRDLNSWTLSKKRPAILPSILLTLTSCLKPTSRLKIPLPTCGWTARHLIMMKRKFLPEIWKTACKSPKNGSQSRITGKNTLTRQDCSCWKR